MPLMAFDWLCLIIQCHLCGTVGEVLNYIRLFVVVNCFNACLLIKQGLL